MWKDPLKTNLKLYIQSEHKIINKKYISVTYKYIPMECILTLACNLCSLPNVQKHYTLRDLNLLMNSATISSHIKHEIPSFNRV